MKSGLTLEECLEGKLTEPDVTLTDFGLAVLCGWFALNLWKQTAYSSVPRTLWVIFFASVSAGSLTGGLVHGFFLDETTLGYRLLWPITLLTIGVTASSAWMIAGYFFSGPIRIQRWIRFSILVYCIYGGVIFFHSQEFRVAIINYLPAMMTLLMAALVANFRRGVRAYLWIAAGIFISFFAAYIQQAKIAIHPNHFDHNSTYHLIQAIGLCILFVGSRRQLKSERALT